MIRKLRFFVVGAALMIGVNTANAVENDARSKDHKPTKCSDILADRHTNDAAKVIGKFCERNPENALAFVVSVLVLKALHNKRRTVMTQQSGP